MAFYTGRSGKLVLNDSTTAKVRDWTLDTSVETLETTALGDSARSYVHGLFSATGSANLSYYTGSTTDVTDLLSRIAKTGAISETDKVELTFEVGTNQYFTANAIINSASISVSTDELTTVAFQFTIDGPLTTVVLTGT